MKQVDLPGSESEFVSVTDIERHQFHQHPWSLRGGGATELKMAIEEAANDRLAVTAREIGRTTHTGEDDAFYIQPAAARTRALSEFCVPLVIGEDVRDYQIDWSTYSIFPYDQSSAEPLTELPEVLDRHFWIYRTVLKARLDYGQNPEERGLQWHEHSMFFPDRFRTPLSIAFAFVATHNHFVLNRGGKVFNRSAPVINLPPGTPEEEHLGLVGLLNSSTGGFWMRQVFFPKGGDQMGDEGARVSRTFWEERFEYDGTKLQQFPIVSERPLELARRLDELAREREQSVPNKLTARATPTAAALRDAWERVLELREWMIALQEELDWHTYSLYGLLEGDLCTQANAVPRVRLGERPFEIVLARKLTAGEVETNWFERHDSTPITEVPTRWPASYRALVEQRIAAIESDRNIALLEQPEYKRRWNDEPWEEQEERALRGWLLDRLEDDSLWKEPVLQSTARLAERVRSDADFMQVAELYRGRPDFDLGRLVGELVEEESVPLLPAFRYKASGRRKRRQWEATWELQRREDAIDARTRLPEDHPERLAETEARAEKAREVGEIPVPPRYKSADFQRPTYWRLRGKLDVPKERFVSLPGCEWEADPTPVVGWAGWSALEKTQAVAAYYVEMKEREGWPADRLVPLLAGLLELVPWVKQWHNELDPEHQVRMGDYFEGFVEDEARRLGWTLEGLRAWEPPAGRKGRRKRRSKRSG